MTPHSKNKYLVTISFLQNYWFAKPLYWCIYNKHAHCIPTSMSVASETKSIPSATARLQYILLSTVVLFPLHSLFFLFFHKKVAPYSITNIWHKAGPHFLAVSPQATVINLVVERFSFMQLFNSVLHAWYSTNTHKLTGPPLTDGDRCYWWCLLTPTLCTLRQLMSYS